MTMAAVHHFYRGPSESRVMTWSFAVHAGVVLALFIVPQEWLTRRRPTPPMMTISLGGSVGPATTGTIPIGGRTVEQTAPPPKRPEPVRPTPKPAPAPTNVAAVRPPTAPARGAKPAPPPSTPPPVTGPQVTRGSTAVDTGARGQGVGLSSGGGTGGEDELKTDFCCPDYVTHIVTTIDANWHKSVADGRGLTVLRFEIQRSGAIVNVTVEQTAGGSLDRLARAALLDSRLQPLPREYTRERLIIHLRFPYGGP